MLSVYKIVIQFGNTKYWDLDCLSDICGGKLFHIFWHEFMEDPCAYPVDITVSCFISGEKEIFALWCDCWDVFIIGRIHLLAQIHRLCPGSIVFPE